jgi:methionyl-tRNA formyltransferase
MQSVSILFFGSTTDSRIVLEALAAFKHTAWDIRIAAVVTQPPKPIGREQTIKKTPTQLWAEEHGVTCLSFPSDPAKPWLYANEEQVIATLQPIQADLIISASYGQKIPTSTLAAATYGGLNVHPSILPRWRGGDPVPWAIMSGDHQIGVTVVSLSEKFDAGLIFAQEKIPITPSDTSTPLRTKLFSIGTQSLVHVLPDFLAGKHKGHAQHIPDDTPQARRLKRELGFEPWSAIEQALQGIDSQRIERKFRALHPWPGLWTTIKIHGQDKRLKLLAVGIQNEKLSIETVQLEGKSASAWEQFTRAYQITA